MSLESTALSWIGSERSRQEFAVRDISVTDSREWVLVDGVVQHVSRRFFDVRGLEWTSSEGEEFCAPFINQPEVGILGIAIAHIDDTHKVLLDAKFEPGNVRGVDVAPSFQATKSNFEQAHGGGAPALSEIFLDRARWRSHVKASEQGTRFLRKWNENVVLEIEPHCDISKTMTWCTREEIASLLHASHTLNTDARSVIATSDWNLWLPDLRPRATSVASALAHGVRESLTEASRSDLVELAQSHLRMWATTHTFSHREVPLSLGTGGLQVVSHARPTGIRLRQLHVTTDSRERENWDQPLLGGATVSEEVLFCTVDDSGAPRFLFNPITEVGLDRAQFGTSVSSIDAGRMQPLALTEANVTNALASSTTMVSIIQSDEGGRFDKQLVSYSLRLIEERSRASDLSPDGLWMTPADIMKLAGLPGFFTNEARTAISLIIGLT